MQVNAPEATPPNPGPEASAPHGRAATASTPHPGFTALALAARLHGVPADPAALAHACGHRRGETVATRDLVLAARGLGLRARAIRSSAARLQHTPLPALAMLRGADGRAHAVVVAQFDPARVLYLDPSVGTEARPTLEPRAAFDRRWTGELVLLARDTAPAPAQAAAFGLGWFLPALRKHRVLLGEVLLMSLVLQVLALVSPLFFQVVVDKVLVHNALTTLDVLVAGWVIVVLFEAALGALRSYLLGHTGHRIDVELGSRVFRHLLALPLAYFLPRRVGDSVARLRELEHIRGFLTGPALMVLLDLLFSCVFVAVMWLYSPMLTLVVLASLPLYAAISLGVTPALRARLHEQFARGADNQALLVETVSAIETVKSSALEPQFARRWDDMLAAFARSGFATHTLAAWTHEAIGLVGKLAQAALLWWGARAVMQGTLSVGEFVAFNLFAQRVAHPVMRLAQFWTELQQTGISIARLGDILNAPREAHQPAASGMAALQGHIRLERVRFSYRAQGQPALDDVSLEIRAGETIGIVGRSGCGKSTLARLIQRLHLAQEGRVLIDGQDIAQADPGQLRRQVAVVLQDNRLFQRSVRDNIAMTDPGAELADVVAAARLSGADGFIRRLPEGYDTVIGEHGTSLSGGQRQRIAIARALFAQPRVLILDEATSALDYESEAALQRNMRHICAGRTVLVIAHRLSSVRHADRIVVLEQGRIVQCGRHEALLAQAGGLYARLWALQASGVPTESQA